MLSDLALFLLFITRVWQYLDAVRNNEPKWYFEKAVQRESRDMNPIVKKGIVKVSFDAISRNVGSTLG